MGFRFSKNLNNLFFSVKHCDGASRPAAADERKYKSALLCGRADNGSCVPAFRVAQLCCELVTPVQF